MEVKREWHRRGQELETDIEKREGVVRGVVVALEKIRDFLLATYVHLLGI